MARYGGPMASSRTALSQLVSPDRRLAWSLTAAARRREWERARVLRSWQAAQRAQQRTARRSARAAPRSAVLGATFLAMAVPAGGSTREVCAGLGAFFGTRAVVALASLRSARQRAGGPPVPALPPPLPLPPPVQSAAFPAVRRLDAAGVALRRLLLTARAGGATVATTADAAMASAAAAERALHAQASQLATVESTAATVVDPRARATVQAAINPLLGDLEEGVAAFEQLLAAAAELASASVVGAAAGEVLRRATRDRVLVAGRVAEPAGLPAHGRPLRPNGAPHGVRTGARCPVHRAADEVVEPADPVRRGRLVGDRIAEVAGLAAQSDPVAGDGAPHGVRGGLRRPEHLSVGEAVVAADTVRGHGLVRGWVAQRTELPAQCLPVRPDRPPNRMGASWGRPVHRAADEVVVPTHHVVVGGLVRARPAQEATRAARGQVAPEDRPVHLVRPGGARPVRRHVGELAH